MLVIRLQRTGRKGHAQFRVVVQDSRRTPTSGRVVAALGSYNPHTKEVILDKEKASLYMSNGAQPSDRVIRLLQAQGVALPSWVKVATVKEGKLRNPEKLRRNQPEQEAAPEVEAPVDEAPAAEPVVEEASDVVEAEDPVVEAEAEAVAPAEETPAEEPKAEATKEA